MTAGEALVSVENVGKVFEIRQAASGRRRRLTAVDDVSLRIRKGEIVALVGESGSGKTTLGRLIMRLATPSSGRVTFAGADVHAAGRTQLQGLRRQMQIVFQDPYGSLDPRMSVSAIVGEGMLSLGRRERDARVREMLEQVGLSPEHVSRYPHELSGGQRQRVGIARALAVDPEFIVLDEPVSALDVSMQSQVLNLLLDLHDRLGLTYLFISHDLAVVRQVADRIAVMYLGQIVEEAPAERIFDAPRHPYTHALLSAMPVVGGRARERLTLSGEIPSAIEPPSHCRFASRCFRAVERSWQAVPELEEIAPAHWVRCFNQLPEPDGSSARRVVDGSRQAERPSEEH